MDGDEAKSSSTNGRQERREVVDDDGGYLNLIKIQIITQLQNQDRQYQKRKGKSTMSLMVASNVKIVPLTRQMHTKLGPFWLIMGKRSDESRNLKRFKHYYNYKMNQKFFLSNVTNWTGLAKRLEITTKLCASMMRH
jgi:hypothetical protein